MDVQLHTQLAHRCREGLCSCRTMVWQLWKIAALLIVLLGITGKVAGLFCGPATADISIIGGNEVNIGDKVVIQCSYTGKPAMSHPYFTINGDDIESQNLQAELSNYEHNHYFTVTSSGCAATHKLTLSNASVEYNGTTYQCYIKPPEEKVQSKTVTLIVRDPATGGTTTDEEGTDGADPSQTSSTTAATLATSLRASATQTTQPSPTTEAANTVSDKTTTPLAGPPTAKKESQRVKEEKSKVFPGHGHVKQPKVSLGHEAKTSDST